MIAYVNDHNPKVKNNKDMTKTMVWSVQHMNKVQQHNSLEIHKNMDYFEVLVKNLIFTFIWLTPLFLIGSFFLVERTLMSPSGGVNRRVDQFLLFTPISQAASANRLDQLDRPVLLTTQIQPVKPASPTGQTDATQ